MKTESTKKHTKTPNTYSPWREYVLNIHHIFSPYEIWFRSWSQPGLQKGLIGDGPDRGLTWDRTGVGPETGDRLFRVSHIRGWVRARSIITRSVEDGCQFCLVLANGQRFRLHHALLLVNAWWSSVVSRTVVNSIHGLETSRRKNIAWPDSNACVLM